MTPTSRKLIAAGAVSATTLLSLALAGPAGAATTAPAAQTCDHRPVTHVAKHNYTGGRGRDVVLVTGRFVTVDAGAGNDLLCGGKWGDKLNGGKGNDTIFGNGGDDTLTAGTGTDHLFGGGGNDHLTCGSGTCTADGGSGRNTGETGTGTATFVRIAKLILTANHGRFHAPAGIPVVNPAGVRLGVVDADGTGLAPLPVGMPAPTATPTAPATASPAPTASDSASPAPTASDSASPAPTASDSASPAPSASDSASPSPSATDTSTPVATQTVTGEIVDFDTAKPVDRAVVTFYPAGEPTSDAVRTATTGPDGKFAFDGVPAGGYTVEGSAKGYDLGSQDLTVADQDVNLTLALQHTAPPAPAAGTVSGTVTDDEGLPLAGITVNGCTGEAHPAIQQVIFGEQQVREACDASVTTVTDAQGHYVLTGLPTGSVLVRVNAQAPASTNTPDEAAGEGGEWNADYSDNDTSVELSVEAGAVNDVSLRTAGAVTGSETTTFVNIFGSGTSQSEVVPDGTTVTATDDQGEVHYGYTSGGTYVVEGLAPGNYTLQTDADDFFCSLHGETSATVVAGETVTAPPMTSTFTYGFPFGLPVL